jgi:hypothetical protein
MWFRISLGTYPGSDRKIEKWIFKEKIRENEVEPRSS